MNVIMTEELLIPLSLAKFAIPISATGKRFINLNPSISIDPLPNKSSKLLGSPYWPNQLIFILKIKMVI